MGKKSKIKDNWVKTTEWSPTVSHCQHHWIIFFSHFPLCDLISSIPTIRHLGQYQACATMNKAVVNASMLLLLNDTWVKLLGHFGLGQF